MRNNKKSDHADSALILDTFNLHKLHSVSNKIYLAIKVYIFSIHNFPPFYSPAIKTTDQIKKRENNSTFN